MIEKTVITGLGEHCSRPSIALQSSWPNKNARHIAVAYMTVEEEQDGLYESILLRFGNGEGWSSEQQIIKTKAFLFPPALCCDNRNNCFIFWTEGKDDKWKLKGRRIRSESPADEEILSIENEKTRFHHPQCAADKSGRIWLVYEEHEGKRSRVKAHVWKNGNWSSPLLISDPEYNAYDPQLSILPDGTVWFVHTEFRAGYYDIFTRSLSNGSLTELQQVSCQNGHSYYPSIACDSKNRVWYAWLAFDGPQHGDKYGLDKLWVRTPLRRHVQSFWHNSRRVFSACLSDGKRFVPVGNEETPGLTSMPLNCFRPRITVDQTGNVRLLARQFNQSSRILAISLKEKGWSKPIVINEDDGLVENDPISCAFEGQKLWLVSQVQDRQRTKNFDYLPGTSQISVGSMVLKDKEASATPILLPFHANSIQRKGKADVLPARVDNTIDMENQEYHLVFGNIHRHTELSICGRHENYNHEFHYRHAIDVQGESFGACTDHGSHMDEHDWRLTMKMAAFYNRPGRFAALPGEEWTSSQPRCGWRVFGHLNIYHIDEKREAFSAHNSKEHTPWQIWRLMDPKYSLTIPHHPAGPHHPYDFSAYDPLFMPVVEIFQDIRGSAEYRDCPGTTDWGQIESSGHFVQDALAKGQRLGFIGGGDHLGVALAGLYVRELSRDGIFEALRARRCFATTGSQVKLEFRVNNHFMGEEFIPAKPGEERKITWRVEGPAAVKKVSLVRNAEDVCNSKSAEFTYIDSVSLDGETYYYIRVEFENGELAWSSPVWVIKNN